MPIRIAPRTRSRISAIITMNPPMASSTCGLRRLPIFTGTPVPLSTMPVSVSPMNARKRPMPAAKLNFKLCEIDFASQPRSPISVMMRKRTPLTKTDPIRCCQVIPSAPSPKAMNAFSPMYGATAMGRFA